MANRSAHAGDRVEEGDLMTNEADDVQAVEKLGQARDAIVGELRKSIVGMDDVIDEMMIAIFARGHCLLVGVPGLAKTLLVSSLAQTMSLSFKQPTKPAATKRTSKARNKLVFFILYVFIF